MNNATTDLTIIKQWLKELLPSDKFAIATEIAEWVLSISKTYPEIQIKAYTTKTNGLDVRFCFDRGHDCDKKRTLTNFFIICENMDMQVLVLSESTDFFNKYKKYLKKIVSFYKIQSAEELWQKNELKEIIYHAFFERAEEKKVKNIKAPNEYLANESNFLNKEKERNSQDKLITRTMFDDACDNLKKSDEKITLDTICNFIEKKYDTSGFESDWKVVLKKQVLEWKLEDDNRK